MDDKPKDALDALVKGQDLPEGEKPRYGPGFMNLDLGQGRVFTQTKLWEFRNYDELNKWFEENGTGLIVVGFGTRTHTYVGGVHQDVYWVLVSKELTEEESEMYSRIQAKVQQLVNEERRAELEAKVAEKEAEEKRVREERELMAAGRTCREHHAALIDENQKLRKENKKLRKEG